MKRYSILLVLSLLCAVSACKAHQYRIQGDHLLLTLRHPDAESVVLFCSFDGFEPRTVKNKSGHWEAEVPAGMTFRYFYRVNDTVFVPDCLLKEKDDLGFENCIYDPGL